MKNISLAISLTLALVSCNSENKKKSTKAEHPTKVTLVTTEDAFFSDSGIMVTPEIYPTEETARQMLKNQSIVGVNNFLHKRQLTPTNNQPVVRMNRDTYYSMAVVNVSKGASITMPTIPEGKYMSVQGVTEDHRIQAMKYGPGTYELTTHIGKHLYLLIRLDGTFSESEVKEIQDKMKIEANSNEEFAATPVNKKSFNEVENQLKAKLPLIAQKDTLHIMRGMFTDPRDKSNEDFTNEKYEVGAAIGWGGAQMIDNIYEASGNFSTDHCYQMTFEDPQDIAFWSITVYDKKGFMFKDLANYSSNTAKINKDGTYTISFGCGENAPNNLEINNPSNYFNVVVRHYQPSKKVIEDNYRLVPLIKEVSN